MLVVTVRAKLGAPDDERARVADPLRDLAVGEHGCLRFVSACDGRDESTLSFGPHEAGIAAWKAHAEHVVARELGRAGWFESHTAEIARVGRAYEWRGDDVSAEVR